jgi:hypothetical protein
MYTFAKARLNLTDGEFWDMSPRLFFIMVAEYGELENTAAYKWGLANNGQTLPNFDKPHEKKKEIVKKMVNPFFF